jgi:hypothetical protein
VGGEDGIGEGLEVGRGADGAERGPDERVEPAARDECDGTGEE